MVAVAERQATSQQVTVQPATQRPVVQDADRQAAEVLLTFARLARGPRDTVVPRHVEVLLKRGYLAPRHLGAFAVITLAGPLTVSELAARAGFAVSTTSLLVTQLAEAGLVERHEDRKDRRRTVVSVAPRYRRESEEVLEAKLAPLRRALERMGPERAQALLEGLGMLTEEVARTSGAAPTEAPLPGEDDGAPA